MTWNQVVNTNTGGNGPLEYRLEILGFDYSFVTNQDMANNTTMPKRVNGLQRSGLTVGQEIILPDMTLKLNSNNFTIVDYQEQATIAFNRRPNFVTRLAQDAETSHCFFFVDSIGNIQNGQILWIGPEAVLVLGYGSNGLNNLIIVQRGYLGTTPVRHRTLTNLGIAVKPRILDIPFTLEKRRCNLYAYGEGDNLQGNGTLIWRGFVNTDPVLVDSTKYSFEAQPISELLNTSIGIEGADIKLRGINLGPWKWAVKLQLLSTNDLQNSATTDSTIVAVGGFYENVYDLANAFDTAIKVATATWAITCGCQISSDGEILFTQKSATGSNAVKYTTIWAPLKNVVPDKNGILDIFVIDTSNTAYSLNSFGEINDTTNTNIILGTSTTYAIRMQAKTVFPTTLTIYAQQTYPGITYPYAADDDYGKRLYLATDIVPSIINDLVIFESENNNMVYMTYPYQSNDIDSDNNNRFVRVTMNSVYSQINSPSTDIAIIGDSHKIYLGTSLGNSKSNAKVGNVASFIKSLIDYSPDNVTSGTTPLLTNDDFDINDMLSVINGLSTTTLATNRGYTFFKQIKKLSDYLKEEYKMIGVFPALTADGKMTIKQLRSINLMEAPDYTLDANDILTDQRYPTIEPNKYGIINQINLSSKYNPYTDKWDGQQYQINNIDSIAISGKGKSIDIKPQSIYQFDTPKYSLLDDKEFEDLLNKTINLFAYPYWVLTIDVPIKYFNVPLGSTIQVINKEIPNFAPMLSYIETRRGTNKLAGNIIAKSFNLEKGVGTLSILVSDKEYASPTNPNQKFIVSPDGFIDTNIVANTSLGSNLYKITVFNFFPYFGEYKDFANRTTATANNFDAYWNIGDVMRFEEISRTTQNSGHGVITDIYSNPTYGAAMAYDVIVNFNYPYSVPTNFATVGRQWVYKFPNYDYAYISATQRNYGFIDSAYVDADNTNRCVGGLSRVLAP